jgi:hypothetical protein
MFVAFWLASLVLAAVFSAVEKRMALPYVDVKIEQTEIAPEANKAKISKRASA